MPTKSKSPNSKPQNPKAIFSKANFKFASNLPTRGRSDNESKESGMAQFVYGVSVVDNPYWEGPDLLSILFLTCDQRVPHEAIILLADALHEHNLAKCLAAAYLSDDDRLIDWFLETQCNLFHDGQFKKNHQVDYAKNELLLHKATVRDIIERKQTQESATERQKLDYLIKSFPDRLKTWLRVQAKAIGERWFMKNHVAFFLTIQLQCEDAVSWGIWISLPTQEKINTINELHKSKKINFSVTRWDEWEALESENQEVREGFDQLEEEFWKELTTRNSNFRQALEKDIAKGSTHIKRFIDQSTSGDINRVAHELGIGDYPVRESVYAPIRAALSGVRYIAYPGGAPNLLKSVLEWLQEKHYKTEWLEIKFNTKRPLNFKELLESMKNLFGASDAGVEERNNRLTDFLNRYDVIQAVNTYYSGFRSLSLTDRCLAPIFDNEQITYDDLKDEVNALKKMIIRDNNANRPAHRRLSPKNTALDSPGNQNGLSSDFDQAKRKLRVSKGYWEGGMEQLRERYSPEKFEHGNYEDSFDIIFTFAVNIYLDEAIQKDFDMVRQGYGQEFGKQGNGGHEFCRSLIMQTISFTVQHLPYIEGEDEKGEDIQKSSEQLKAINSNDESSDSELKNYPYVPVFLNSPLNEDRDNKKCKLKDTKVKHLVHFVYLVMTRENFNQEQRLEVLSSILDVLQLAFAFWLVKEKQRIEKDSDPHTKENDLNDLAGETAQFLCWTMCIFLYGEFCKANSLESTHFDSGLQEVKNILDYQIEKISDIFKDNFPQVDITVLTKEIEYNSSPFYRDNGNRSGSASPRKLQTSSCRQQSLNATIHSLLRGELSFLGGLQALHERQNGNSYHADTSAIAFSR